MNAQSFRPSIHETCYRLFTRPLHPELFSPAVVGRLKTSKYSVSLGICSGGHFLQLSDGQHGISEVTAPDSQVLTSFGHQRTYFFQDDVELQVEADCPFRYRFTGQIDPVEYSVFSRVQMELEEQAHRAFLSFRYPAKNRLFPGPLSLIQVEGSERMLNVHTFHTFPEDSTILRTQTLFELN